MLLGNLLGSIISLLFSFLILLSYYLFKKLHTSSNRIILSLAFADIIFNVTSLAQWGASSSSNENHTLACDINGYILNTTNLSIAFLSCWLARYLKTSLIKMEASKITREMLASINGKIYLVSAIISVFPLVLQKTTGEGGYLNVGYRCQIEGSDQSGRWQRLVFLYLFILLSLLDILHSYYRLTKHFTTLLEHIEEVNDTIRESRMARMAKLKKEKEIETGKENGTGNIMMKGVSKERGMEGIELKTIENYGEGQNAVDKKILVESTPRKRSPLGTTRKSSTRRSTFSILTQSVEHNLLVVSEDNDKINIDINLIDNNNEKPKQKKDVMRIPTTNDNRISPNNNNNNNTNQKNHGDNRNVSNSNSPRKVASPSRIKRQSSFANPVGNEIIRKLASTIETLKLYPMIEFISWVPISLLFVIDYIMDQQLLEEGTIRFQVVLFLSKSCGFFHGLLFLMQPKTRLCWRELYHKSWLHDYCFGVKATTHAKTLRQQQKGKSMEMEGYFESMKLKKNFSLKNKKFSNFKIKRHLSFKNSNKNDSHDNIDIDHHIESQPSDVI